jgi:acyl carrier protein
MNRLNGRDMVSPSLRSIDMPDTCDMEAVRERIAHVLISRLGGVEEELVGTGLLDSLKAISLALTLEKEFGVSLEDISVDDMVTLSSLTRKIHSLLGQPQPPARTDSTA